MILFVHIPKTGGMSLGPVIARQFSPQSAYNINGTLPEMVKTLDALPPAQRDRIEYLFGHVPFGLHVCFSQPVDYITMLRSPVDRIVSAYYYARRRPEWGFHKPIVEQNLSLDDFVVSDIAGELHNQQTLLLSGTDGPCNAAVLDQAKENLTKHFALVGLTERFDESVLLCRATFGWKNVLYRRRNVNRRRVQLEDVDPKVVAAIEARNLLDLELYQFAQNWFNQQIAQHQAFEAELQRFRRRNWWYDNLLRLRETPRQWIRERSAKTGN